MPLEFRVAFCDLVAICVQTSGWAVALSRYCTVPDMVYVVVQQRKCVTWHLKL